MRFEVRGKGVPLSAEVLEQLDRRFRFELGRFEGRVRDVRVSLADLNGPKGGVDLECKVRATLTAGEPIVVQQRAASVVEAVNIAADRLGRALRREIERRREHRTAAFV